MGNFLWHVFFFNSDFTCDCKKCRVCYKSEIGAIILDFGDRTCLDEYYNVLFYTKSRKEGIFIKRKGFVRGRQEKSVTFI